MACWEGKEPIRALSPSIPDINVAHVHWEGTASPALHMLGWGGGEELVILAGRMALCLGAWGSEPGVVNAQVVWDGGRTGREFACRMARNVRRQLTNRKRSQDVLQAVEENVERG